MTKLVIQIPCFNEEQHLAAAVRALPDRIEGVDCIELLVVDDGSQDRTSDAARAAGVHHIVRHRSNRGLASAFQTGIDLALKLGADIIVNTDADGQYHGDDVVELVKPIIAGEADIVIGDRGVRDNLHFGFVKRQLQILGSAMVRWLSRTEISDAVSGFRAISREAAQNLSITSEFSYTTDMLIQAGRKRMRILSVPVRTNAAVRPSRLFRSVPGFIVQTGITIARTYTTYNPLRAFAGTGLLVGFIGVIPILRFLWFYLSGTGGGHIQSLVIGGALMTLGTLFAILGVVGDLIATNRKLLEVSLVHIRQLEERIELLARPAEPGDVAATKKTIAP